MTWFIETDSEILHVRGKLRTLEEAEAMQKALEANKALLPRVIARCETCGAGPYDTLSIIGGQCVECAQAIEARRAVNAEGGAVEDESAVPQGCAQGTQP